MALGMFAFSLADVQAKFLAQDLHPLQVAWFRQSGLFVGVIVLFLLKGPGLFRTPHPVLQITRGVLAAVSATLFIVGIRYIPLADAVAISFIAPFVVTVLSALVLREPVGLRRWIAVTLGFAGTLIIIRPGTGVMHPAAFVIIFAATFFALRQIVSRKLAASDNVATTVAFTAVAALVVLSVPQPFVWAWPDDTKQILLLISLAACAGIGEFFVIKALEIALAVVVAPVQYLLLIFGTIYGYLVFDQFPDAATWIGALIIVATGLYMLNRERHDARMRRKARAA